METVTVKKLKEKIYLMRDNQNTSGYVVLGTKKALVIDTMNGTEDIKKAVETVTNLPIILVSTHGHPDHVAGNFYFEEALIHPADIELTELCAKEMTEVLVAEGVMSKEVASRKLKWRNILPGDTVDLGDRKLEIYSLAGHTKGSIGILDRENRVFFVGDGINDHLWMQLEECLSFPEYLDTLNDLNRIRNDFDYILTGHGTDLIDASLIEEVKEAIKEIIAGNNKEDFDYEYFDGIVKAHPYGDPSREPRKLVVYNPKRM